MPKENLDVLEAVTLATEELVPVGTEEMLFLRGRVDVLEEDRKLLQETLASKEYVKYSAVASDQRLHCPLVELMNIYLFNENTHFETYL